MAAKAKPTAAGPGAAADPPKPEKGATARPKGQVAGVPSAAEQAKREAEARKARQEQIDLFRLHLHHLRPLHAAVVAAKEAIKVGPGKEEKLYRAKIEADGFPLAIVDAILEIEDKKEPRKLQAQNEDMRLLMFEAANLAIGRTADQLELDLRQPDPVKDKADARTDGYAAGMRGDECEPPVWVHPVNHQDWIAGWGDGQTVIARTMEQISTKRPLKGTPEGDKAPAASDPERATAENIVPGELRTEGPGPDDTVQ